MQQKKSRLLQLSKFVEKVRKSENTTCLTFYNRPSKKIHIAFIDLNEPW